MFLGFSFVLSVAIAATRGCLPVVSVGARGPLSHVRFPAASTVAMAAARSGAPVMGALPERTRV